MKKIRNTALLIAFIGGVINAIAQPSNASCATGENVCANNGSTFPLWSGTSPNPVVPSPGSFSNPNSNPQGVNSGCLLSTELNPNWFVITAGSAGNLVFTIGAAGGNGFYDWAMWPYDPSDPTGSGSCGGISGNTLAPVACNWNA